MNKRDYIGIFAFFMLGMLINALACIIAVYREYAQYESSGVLEHNDIKNYVIWAAVGALAQTMIIYIIK